MTMNETRQEFLYTRCVPANSNIRVELFGTPTNWTLLKNRKKIFNHIIDTLPHIEQVFIPNLSKPTASIMHHRRLDAPKVKCGRLSIHTEFLAEGLLCTGSTNAFLIFPADCPTIIAYTISDPAGPFICAHAGRDSLVISPKLLKDRALTTYRSKNSVVDSIMNTFAFANPSQIGIYIVPGIGPENFQHPTDHVEYGADNAAFLRKLSKDYGKTIVTDSKRGCIDLVALITRQCVAKGVKPGKIKVASTGETYGTTDPDDLLRPLWHSCRRATENCGDPLARNAVLIYRV